MENWGYLIEVVTIVQCNLFPHRGCDRASSPIGEPNLKDRSDRWENLSRLSITPQSCVEPMWDRIIPYPLRNRTSVDDIHSG